MFLVDCQNYKILKCLVLKLAEHIQIRNQGQRPAGGQLRKCLENINCSEKAENTRSDWKVKRLWKRAVPLLWRTTDFHFLCFSQHNWPAVKQNIVTIDTELFVAGPLVSPGTYKNAKLQGNRTRPVNLHFRTAFKSTQSAIGPFMNLFIALLQT